MEDRVNVPNEPKQAGLLTEVGTCRLAGRSFSSGCCFPASFISHQALFCHFLRSFTQRLAARLGGSGTQHAAEKAPRSQGRDSRPAALPPRLRSDWRFISCAFVLFLSAPASKRRTLTRSPLNALQTSPIRNEIRLNAFNMSSLNVNVCSGAFSLLKNVVFLRYIFTFSSSYFRAGENLSHMGNIFFTWQFPELMIEKSNSIPDFTLFLLQFWLTSECIKAFYCFRAAEMKSWGSYYFENCEWHWNLTSRFASAQCLYFDTSKDFMHF